MASVGWISLHRKITDSWLWDDKPFSKGQAWIDIILKANHEEKEVLIDGEILTISRGSFHTSILKMSDRFGWERKKTTKFLNLLESQNMITTKRTTHGTTITIVNYGKYQTLDTTKGAIKDTNHSATERQPRGNDRDTNNNINNDNNDNKFNAVYLESQNSAPNLTQYKIILNDKSYYYVPLEKLTLWKETYLAVDVEMELRKMGSWCDSNVTKRKTRKGIERFINNWLAREQDKGGTKANNKGYVTTYNQNSFNNFQQNDYDFEALERELLAN